MWTGPSVFLPGTQLAKEQTLWALPYHQAHWTRARGHWHGRAIGIPFVSLGTDEKSRLETDSRLRTVRRVLGGPALGAVPLLHPYKATNLSQWHWKLGCERIGCAG